MRVALNTLKDIRGLKIERLSEVAIKDFIKSYNLSSWNLVHTLNLLASLTQEEKLQTAKEREENRTVIKRSFAFKDFNEAMSFLNCCAYIAEDSDHHPEWSNVFNRVEVLFSTHDAGGVTTKDILMAKGFVKTHIFLEIWGVLGH